MKKNAETIFSHVGFATAVSDHRNRSQLNALMNEIYLKHVKYTITNILQVSSSDEVVSLETKLTKNQYATSYEFEEDLKKAVNSIDIHALSTITVINSRRKTSKVRESINKREIIEAVIEQLDEVG